VAHRIPPWSEAPACIFNARGRFISIGELPATGLVEAKFFLALDLHDSRVLDYNLYRSEAHTAYRIDNALEDLVARVGLRLKIRAGCED